MTERPPNWIDDYVRYVSTGSDTPELYSRVSALSLLGNALCRRCEPLLYGHEQVRTNFWTLIIGPSTEARKSTQLRVFRRMARRSVEGLIAPTDGSREGIIDFMEDNPVTTLTYDEFKHFADWMDRKYNDGTKGVFTTMYDWSKDEPYTMARAKNRFTGEARNNTVIQGPALGIYACTTPDWLSAGMSADDFASGFFARFLFCCYPGRTITHDIPPQGDANLFEQLAHQLKIGSNNRYRFDAQQSTGLYYAKWMKGFLSSSHVKARSELRPIAHRWTVYAWKIAMVYAASELIGNCMIEAVTKTVMLEKRHVHDAATILDKLLALLANTLEDELAATPHQRRRRDVLRAVAGAGGIMKRKDLMRSLRWQSNELHNTLSAMVEEEKVELIKYSPPGSKGRTPEYVLLIESGSSADEQRAAALHTLSGGAHNAG